MKNPTYIEKQNPNNYRKFNSYHRCCNDDYRINYNASLTVTTNCAALELLEMRKLISNTGRREESHVDTSPIVYENRANEHI